MSESFKIPILLLVYNRLSETQQVFQMIKKVKPRKLYIGADGPRVDVEGEAEEVEKILSFLKTNVDWDCELKILTRETNLGCKIAVSGAIDWFFENEEMGIILEDDCLPSISFFFFCEELLKHYAANEKVMFISGTNLNEEGYQYKESYHFSIYNHVWGWATWRRVWEKYDVKMNSWPELKKTNFLERIVERNRMVKYWHNMFDCVYSNKIDTWAYQLLFSFWVNEGRCITPSKNLVKNIGFSKNATHTSYYDSSIARMKPFEINFPLKHPGKIVVNKEADIWEEDHHYSKKLIYKIRDKLKKFFKLFKNI